MQDSLRTRLTVTFVVLAIVPLLAVGTILAWRSFAAQREQALRLQGEVARRVAADTTAFLAAREEELRAMIEFRGLGRLDPQQRAEMLSGMLAYRQNIYEDLILLDDQGQEEVRLSRRRQFEAAELASWSGVGEFEIPRANGEAYFSSISVDDETGEPFMTISLPLIDLHSGDLTGVLVARFRFMTIFDLMATSQVGTGDTVYLVDDQDRVIAHQDPSIVLRGTRFALPAEGGLHRGLDGTRVALATYGIRLHEQTFTVVAEQPTSTALTLAFSAVYITAGVTVASLVAAGGAGVLMALRIVRPVEALAATAQAIREGDLSRQAEVTGRDEVGRLAEAFNAMTAQLRALIGNLEQRVAERTRGLQAVAEVSQATTSVLELDALLGQVVDLVCERFDLYYVGLFLLDGAGQNAVLHAGTGDAGRQMLERGHRLQVDGPSMIGQCVARNEARIAPDAGAEAVRFANPLLPETRSEVALPLRARGRIVGAMSVQSAEAAAFDEAAAGVLQSLADQVGVAIDNARLFEQITQANAEIRALNERLQEENLRLEAELDVTRRLQQMLLPAEEELRQVEGLDIAAFMEPAEEVGGDYYDVLYHDGQVKIGIGDVTGHGLESGVVMLMVQTAVRTLLTSGERNPIDFMTVLNRILHDNIQRMRVDKSLTLALLDYESGRADRNDKLRLSGQHEHLIVVRQEGQVELVDTFELGFPLGLEHDIAPFVGEVSVDLAPGDGVVLYSDGFTEAENARGEFYGLDRLCAVASQQWPQPANGVVEAIVADVRDFIGEQTVYDDLTLVVLKRK